MNYVKNILIGFLLIAFTGSVFAQGSGNCLEFDGTDDYVNVPDIINNGDFTIELWFSPTVATFDECLLDLSELGGTQSWRKYFFIDVRQNRIRFHFEDDADRDSQITAAYNFTPGTWYHIAAVGGFNRTDPHRLYVNGVQVGTDNDNFTGKPTTFAPFISLGFPQSPYLVSATPFSGYMDEVRIWNDERSQAEIRDNMCRRLTGAEADLELLYRMDESGALMVTDNSGNANNGAMTNMTTADWVYSGAPIGNTSVHNYTGAWGSVSLTHTSPEGDSFEVSAVSGTPDGYHIYHVESIPNVTTGINGLGGNDHYYGVFKTGDPASTYTATYFYTNNDAYQSSIPAIIEPNIRMYIRDDNADLTWANSGGTTNPIPETVVATGMNTEYILGILGASGLPVEWLGFEAHAEPSHNQLLWSTASELNCSHYEIEKSLDGQNFEYIGTVNGSGNSATVQHYAFNDNDAQTGVCFYRLRQVDLDGQFEYSEVVSVNRQEEQELVVYPNPVNDVFMIQADPQKVFDLIDASRRVIKNVNGNTQIAMDDLPAGIYILVAQEDGRTVRLIKQ